MQIKRVLYLFVFLFTIVTASAQELTVAKMETLSMDTYASVHKRVDLNNTPCAVVRVSLTVSGATFSGNVMGDVQRDGSDYLVYMPAGSKKLWVKHPNFHELEINFSSYGIDRLQSLVTYRVTINAPQAAGVQKITTVQRSTENIVFPEWMTSRKDTWCGVSLPCSNPVLAKKHALVNAFFLYMLNSGKAKDKSLILYKFSNESYSANNYNTERDFRSVEQLTIDSVLCNVDREFYNNRGEYIVECNFAQSKSGKCKCSITRSVVLNSKDGTLNSQINIAAEIDGEEIVINTKYDENNGCTIEIDGNEIINNRMLTYNDISWKSDDVTNQSTYKISTSYGEAMTQLLSSLPWIPTSFQCKSLSSQGMTSSDGNETSKFQGSYKVTVDAMLKSDYFTFDKISGNQIIFNVNSYNSTGNIVKSKNGDAVQMVLTSLPMQCTFEQQSYLNVFVNLWRLVIANSLIYDRLSPMDLEQSTSVGEYTGTNYNYNYNSGINTKSELFDISYSISQSTKELSQNLRLITKANDLLFTDHKPSKDAIARSKELKKDGWLLLSGPMGFDLDDVIFQHYMCKMEGVTSEKDGKLVPKYIINESTSISHDLCDAILESISYNYALFQSAKESVFSSDGVNTSIKSKASFVPPSSWGYMLYRPLANGDVEVLLVEFEEVEK